MASRYPLVFLVAILLASVSFADCDFDGGGSLIDSIRSYMKEGESLETRGVTVSGENYTLAIINGAESMLFLDSSKRPITDPALIYPVLKTEYLDANKVAVDSQKLIESINSFNESRFPQQSTCEQYTGTDTHPCSDFATCRYACLSVPLCRGNFEGNGDNFINAIISWRTKNSEMDKAIAGFKDSSAGIASNPELAGTAGSHLTAIEERATEIQGNRLFMCESGGFCFCYQVNFSFAKINEAKDGLSQIQAVLSKLPDLEKKSNVLAGIADQRIRERNQNDVICQYQDLVTRSKANLTGMKARVTATLKLVDSPTLSKNFNDLVNISDEISRRGDEKNYSGALELKDSYFDLALVVSVLSSALEQNYSRMNSSLELAREKLEQDINLTAVGEYFSREHTSVRLELEELQSLAKTPIKESSMALIEANATALPPRLVWLENSAKTAIELLERAEIARTNLTALQAKASEYKQAYDFAEVEGAINSSIRSAKSIKFSEAEESIKLAYEKTVSYSVQLTEIIPLIQKAREDSASANSYLSERKSASFIFFGVDSQRAEALCLQASNTVYSSPRDSSHFSQECKNTIDSELQGLEYKKYGFFVVVLIFLYLFYKWARKREWGFVIG
ncbi:MAG: hypothetical protein ABIF01_00045 [Candidatus Micrarchaeota archaeon]